MHLKEYHSRVSVLLIFVSILNIILAESTHNNIPNNCTNIVTISKLLTTITGISIFVLVLCVTIMICHHGLFFYEYGKCYSSSDSISNAITMTTLFVVLINLGIIALSSAVIIYKKNSQCINIDNIQYALQSNNLTNYIISNKLKIRAQIPR